MSTNASWACPLCQAADGAVVAASAGVIDTHVAEHSDSSARYSRVDGRIHRNGGLAYAPKPQKLADFESSIASAIGPEAMGCASEACCADDDRVAELPGQMMGGAQDICPACNEPRTLYGPGPFGHGDHAGPADLDPGPDQTILEEAQSLTRGARQAAYGHPMSDFTCMGTITAAILGRFYESIGYALVKVNDDGSFEEPSAPFVFPPIPARIATMLMQSVKLSREAAVPKRDNRVDGAGYWDTTDMAVEAERDGI